ncbi:LOW QUALITY PROTEIN: trifunctional purine biosynthetic protein adenosine-3-like [Pomacea canaliculata]|uniref:LOW QUALITY PROTEIN: trifunctional purine biosynthetic protein adenosine-3-like n=1 Tax=Pomacea canaliculata TaxID=400727 RepID=UPI000D7331F2|nr:LOW QUALITY PROTEIN: trifunctional purine biosynthetic protein adenosine-3-like [Pomacea canaliculata]
MSSAKVLLIGSGGRESALAWKLAQSANVEAVYVAPGNAGTNDGRKMINVDLNLKDFDSVSNWCKEHSVSLVVVGPEDPLAEGIADHLSKKGIGCFGPSASAAEIESSKDFAKQFMLRHGIPTARFQSFTNADEACQHIMSADYAALVVKASGLAAGKGVVVATTREEACQAARSMLADKIFGTAGDTVVVEELLQGEEVSILAFTDGESVAMMPPAQDHKRLGVGDTGPNTGGMGAYCPYPKISDAELQFVKDKILQRTVDGMKKEGRKYIGVLYAGIMLTREGPNVLEFNCRFGDPETQSLMPLLSSDLYLTCKACVEGRLKEFLPEFDEHQTTLGVVLVSGGYPGSYKKDLEITGISEAEAHGLIVFHAGTKMKDRKIVTNGGRVLAVVAVDTDLFTASERAQKGAAQIHFDGVFYRTDIGFRVLHSSKTRRDSTFSYISAGVDIAAGNELVENIKPLSKSTHRKGCISELGMFGALFDMKALGYQDPILVSGTDGVGTKLKVAHAVGKHDTIGIDLVAMCVNDILAHGAEPLFFLDYFATGKLHVGLTTDVVRGITEGCKQAGCALVGGETAEMPGMYAGEDYDIAGFAVGAVERSKMLPRMQDIRVDDVVIGLASSGLHSNGYSLVRRLIEKKELRYDMPSPFKTGNTLGVDLLTPTKIYVNSLLPLMREGKVKAFAHITGGGLLENLPRVLPEHLEIRLDAKSWVMPPVFGWLSEIGNISEKEMARTFNCGIGAVLVINKSDLQLVLDRLAESGEKASVIGVVEQKSGLDQVRIKHLKAALAQSWKKVPGVTRKKRVAVLISGTGTNLQALIDHTKNPANNSAAEIVLVLSNKPDVQGLYRAQQAGISTKVINHKNYKTREEFDAALHESLLAGGIEIVCLAGFMRILTGGFVSKWKGKMLNIHPSLLPSFKGAHAHKLVLEAGVRVTGCTVHFVSEEVDAGAIIVQEPVPVYPGETEESLSERVKTVERKAYPAALELLASERIQLQENGKLLWK